MKNEQQLVYKVIQNFEGMHKIDVLDVLQEIEVLLYDTSSPVTKASMRAAINLSFRKDVKQKDNAYILLPNGNLCECIDTNDWVYIYKEQKKGIYSIKLFDTYYFKVKNLYAEPTELNRENLLAYFKDTAEEIEIRDFLSKNKRANKEKFISKLLLLDL